MCDFEKYGDCHDVHLRCEQCPMRVSTPDKDRAALAELRENLASNITLFSHHKSMLLKLVDEKIAALRTPSGHGGGAVDGVAIHASDCAANNAPAFPVASCNCGALELARRSKSPAPKVATVGPVAAQETPGASPNPAAGGGVREAISLIEAFTRLQRRLMLYCQHANAGHMPSDAREFTRRIFLGFLSAYEEAGISAQDLIDYLEFLEQELIGCDADLKLPSNLISPAVWADRVRAALRTPSGREICPHCLGQCNPFDAVDPVAVEACKCGPMCQDLGEK